MPIVLARIEFQVQDIFGNEQVSLIVLKEEFCQAKPSQAPAPALLAGLASLIST